MFGEAEPVEAVVVEGRRRPRWRAGWLERKPVPASPPPLTHYSVNLAAVKLPKSRSSIEFRVSDWRTTPLALAVAVAIPSGPWPASLQRKELQARRKADMSPASWFPTIEKMRRAPLPHRPFTPFEGLWLPENLPCPSGISTLSEMGKRFIEAFGIGPVPVELPALPASLRGARLSSTVKITLA